MTTAQNIAGNQWRVTIPNGEEEPPIIRTVFCRADANTETDAIALATGSDIDPGQKAARELSDARTSAASRVTSALRRYEQAIIGKYSDGERATWSKQEAAARAYDSGNATAEHLDVLDARCNVTGETRGEFAAKVIANADAFTVQGLWLSGMRDKHSAAVEAATTPAEASAAADAAVAEIAAGPA